MAPKKVKEDLVIFEQLANLAASSEPAWADFYRICAQGKFPLKVKVIDKTLIFRKPTRAVVCPLPAEVTPTELDRCNRFFKDEVGVSVGQVIPVQTVETVPLIKRLQRLKKLRNIHLHMYTRMIAERDGLAPSQQEQLFSVLALGWLSGLIQHHSLRIDIGPNGVSERIVEIKGIERDAQGLFYIQVPANAKLGLQTRSSTSRTKNKLQEQWLQYSGGSKKRDPRSDPRDVRDPRASCVTDVSDLRDETVDEDIDDETDEISGSE